MTNVLTWLREVDDRARADTGDRPSVQQINLVSMHRVLYADPDGGSCYPAQATLSHLCGVNRKTVRAVDEWLIENSLMVFVRNRARGQKEYRLDSDDALPAHLDPVDIPSDGAPADHLTTDSDGTAETHVDSDGSPDEPQMGLQRPTTLDLQPVNQGFTDDLTGRAVDERFAPVLASLVAAQGRGWEMRCAEIQRALNALPRMPTHELVKLLKSRPERKSA